MHPWPQRNLDPLPIRVGPCAWHVSMLLNEHAEYVRAHPSLIVVCPDDDEATLRAAAARLGDLPVLLGVQEPAFSRRLPDLVRQRLEWLGRSRADIVTLNVDEPRGLKGGGVMQGLFRLRDEGVLGQIGLAHADAREIEWLALHTNARLLVTPYHLLDQSARYRALAAAEEHGMAVVATGEWQDGRWSPVSDAAAAFSLADATRALPVFGAPITKGATFDVESSWRDYQATHAAPDPLPRGPAPGIV